MMIREFFERRKASFGADVFQCLLCPRDFMREDQMRAHLRLAHEGQLKLESTRVSCLMVASRPTFLQGAIRMWALQSWRNRELIIVWDDGRPMPPIPDHPDIKLIKAPAWAQSIGAKRNLGIQEAQGDFIMHWDDDDLHAPYRIERAVHAMLQSKALIGGCSEPVFQDERNRVWRYSSPTPHLSGASLIYRREAWQRQHFEDRNVGEDSSFVRGLLQGRALRENPEVTFLDGEDLRCLIHAGNTSPKPIGEASEYQPHLIAPRALPERDRLVLGLLAWNTDQISLESAQALLKEARMLRGLGFATNLCLVDNGSTDQTREFFQAFAREASRFVPCRLILNNQNLGNSIARNQMIHYALGVAAKYLLFTDGDLELIPFSTLPLMGYLDQHPEVGCAGLYSGSWTRKREEATPILDWLDWSKPEMIQPVAWTQYGLFRAEMFRSGIRFESRGPFAGPGWGFEDNDLWLQMKQAGFGNACFYGARYLHRDKQSSLGLLRKEGLDPQALYAARKQFLKDKWASIPIMKDEIAKLTATELRNEQETNR